MRKKKLYSHGRRRLSLLIDGISRLCLIFFVDRDLATSNLDVNQNNKMWISCDFNSESPVSMKSQRSPSAQNAGRPCIAIFAKRNPETDKHHSSEQNL